MRAEYLDVLDLMNEDTPVDIKNLWISKLTQKQLYQIASWLMMYLSKESQGTEHKRSQIRDILTYYYTNRHLGEPWTPRQKYYVGYAVINLWQYRQLDRDPRFLLD